MISRPVSFIKPIDLTKARWLAPLSKRYARIASLQTLPPNVALIAGNCVAFDEGRVIFVKNHKAACSTIAQLIYLHQNGSVCEGNIHKDYKGLIQGLPNFPAVAAALIARDTFKFTFVRHPVSRAVSAFKNIFLEKSNEAWTLHAKSIWHWGFSDSASASANFDVFLDYVTESLHQNAQLTDPHFRRQVDNTGINALQFDFIGRVEEMGVGLDRLSGIFGSNVEALRAQTALRANRSDVDFSPNTDQIGRLQEIYRSDFEIFGYTNSVGAA